MTVIDPELASARARSLALGVLEGEEPAQTAATALAEAVQRWRAGVRRDAARQDPMPEAIARWGGQEQAVLAHALLQSAYALEPASAGDGQRALVRCRTGYGRALADLQAIARGEAFDPGAVHGLAVELVLGPARTAARWIGSLDAARRGSALQGLQCSELLRRCCALLGWVCFIDHRRSSGPSRRGLAQVAENRALLRRQRQETHVGDPYLFGVEAGTRVKVAGLVREVGWVERPDIPYSFARLGARPVELRVHRRSLLAVGVAPGRWLWARGKAEPQEGPDGDRAIVVAEFEGLHQHAGDSWEDWLASETREVYDLAPSSLDVLWELPHPRRQFGAMELAARMPVGLVEASP